MSQGSDKHGPIEPAVSEFLDLCRWFSAFLVVVSHAAHLFVMDDPLKENGGSAVAVAYFFTSLGHQAVVAFFVISGYLVGGISLDRWRRSGIDISHYVSSRTARIYTVLVPALLVGYALDVAGARWLNGGNLYSPAGHFHVGSLDDVAPRLGLKNLIGNGLMLQGIMVDPLGSNGPLWSLAYEWWYYTLFLLGAAVLLTRKAWRCVWAIAAVGLLLFLPWRILLWMTVWLLGVAAYFANRARIAPMRPGMALLQLFVILVLVRTIPGRLLAYLPGFYGDWAADLMVGISFSLVIASYGVPGARPWASSFHPWAAGFSYSVYLFHFPILLFLAAVGERYFGWALHSSPTLNGYLLALALTAGAYLLVYPLYLLFESRTDQVRKGLRRLFGALGLTGK